jgi:hypothetical protein
MEEAAEKTLGTRRGMEERKMARLFKGMGWCSQVSMVDNTDRSVNLRRSTCSVRPARAIHWVCKNGLLRSAIVRISSTVLIFPDISKDSSPLKPRRSNTSFTMSA